VVNKSSVKINKKDLNISTMRGSGPGGQHRNKTDSAVLIRHIPTGVTAYCDMKSQFKSKEMAMEVLISRLEQLEKDKQVKAMNKKRERQSGSKGRGGKSRTVSEKRNEVIDHRTGKKMKYKDYVRGFIEKLQ
jgi:peptide chain release factor 1